MTTTDLKQHRHDHNQQTAINNQIILTMDTVMAHTRVQKQFKEKHLTHEARTWFRFHHDLEIHTKCILINDFTDNLFQN